MQNLPFDKPGRFWRGNLHCHSTESDGKLTPQEVCAFYQRNGYDFISLTDHFLENYGYPMTNTQPYRDDAFTTLIGAELHAGQTELGQLWHILAVGLPLDFAAPTADETGPQITARALASGAYVAAAHPAWYSLTENDVRSLGDIHAIEVYNGTSHDHNDRADSWYMLDLMLMRGQHYTACATDDAHFRDERADALLGWVHVKAEQLTPDAILAALKAGWYYSSTGPQIHDIRITNDELIVDCSPVERIFVTGTGFNAVVAQGRGLRTASFPLSRIKGPYARVTVRDVGGGRAWSNPFWLRG